MSVAPTAIANPRCVRNDGHHRFALYRHAVRTHKKSPKPKSCGDYIGRAYASSNLLQYHATGLIHVRHQREDILRFLA